VGLKFHAATYNRDIHKLEFMPELGRWS